MDIFWFLKHRTAFIRSFYKRASQPFVDTKEQINNSAPPFDKPPFDESGDPPYLEEWQDAEDALEVLGQMCLSCLTTALQLYLRETVGKVRQRVGANATVPPLQQKRGFAGYETWFGNFDIQFQCARANIQLIREIISTRNLIQHPESIALMHAHQRDADHKRFRRPFFAHPIEKAIADRAPQFEPRLLWIGSEALTTAVDEVERFCQWLEDELWATEFAGRVTNYFRRPQVAAVKLCANVSIGDGLRFTNDHTCFEQELVSMEIDRTSVPTAEAGTEVGIRVNQRVGAGTRVYRRMG